MTEKEAKDLAERIKREAGDKVETKIGCTNGSHLVHLIVTVERDDKRPGKTRKSFDIITAAAWDLHGLRRANRPRKAAKTDKQDGNAMLANEAAVNEALSTIYEP